MKYESVETEEVVELTPEEIAELDDRADAVERGEYVDGDEVIRRLRTGYYAYELLRNRKAPSKSRVYRSSEANS
jgi:hypothetical protein